MAGIATVVSRIRSVVSPIDELVEATRRVGAGDYSVRIARPRRATARAARAGQRASTRWPSGWRSTRTSAARSWPTSATSCATPLAVVRGNLEAIVDGVHPADRNTWRTILDETLVLGRLVDDLRTVALSEAGRLPLHREPTDLGLLLEEAGRSFEALAAAGQVTIVVAGQTDPELPPLDVDPVRIREVLDNLIANALRYTPAGGTITVRAEQPAGGSAVQVTVADTGTGIAPDVADHLFDRFAKTTESRGSGLGLAIARHIVEAHGGSIEVGGGSERRDHDPVQPAPGRSVAGLTGGLDRCHSATVAGGLVPGRTD